MKCQNIVSWGWNLNEKFNEYMITLTNSFSGQAMAGSNKRLIQNIRYFNNVSILPILKITSLNCLNLSNFYKRVLKEFKS